MGNHLTIIRSKQKFKKSGTKEINSHSKEMFILSLRSDRIQMVNANNKELLLITPIIRCHCSVLREGWIRSMTYSYKLKKTTKNCMIRLVSDILLSLDEAGWDPLAPLDMEEKNMRKQTAICFRKKKKKTNPYKHNMSRLEAAKDKETSRVCIELYLHRYLIFHTVPNTVLNELVSSANTAWKDACQVEGITGVSRAVFSVISDYSILHYPVLSSSLCQGAEKFVKLQRKFVSSDEKKDEIEDDTANDNLEVSIIACLAKVGYKLSMAISLDKTIRVFFFIINKEDPKEIRQQTKAIAGIGTKDSLSTYRPIIERSRSSFFRSFNGRASLNRRVKLSLKKKIGKNSFRIRSKQKSEWFAQTSTDIASEFDDDSEDKDDDSEDEDDVMTPLIKV